MTRTSIDWNDELLAQLTYHWEAQQRPRLEGLTDEEYLWEPVPGSWNVRPRGSTSPAVWQAGEGAFTIDYDPEPPTPTPVTTIAWRLAHITVGVLGARVAGHFGGPPMDHRTHVHPGTAAEALAQLDAAYDAWVAGVRSLGDEGLARPSGPAEGPWHESPLATLVLHIHREVIHHGAEVALLRDLYAHRAAG